MSRLVFAKIKPFLLILLIFLFLNSLIVNSIFAQISSSGIAITVPVVDDQVQNGDIICTYKEGNKRCFRENDPSLFGVISENPAASVEDRDIQSFKLVVTSGITKVRVSSINGDISEGDFVTSSQIQGVGQKATKNGLVLGTALESYQSDNPQDVGVIQVLVNIHPASISGARGNLLQFIREGVTVPVFEPVESLRYILAALMVIIAFSLGMIYFGRASRAGIEAIGRNPLAKRIIQLTTFLNILLTIVIVLVGLGIAYIILVL